VIRSKRGVLARRRAYLLLTRARPSLSGGLFTGIADETSDARALHFCFTGSRGIKPANGALLDGVAFRANPTFGKNSATLFQIFPLQLVAIP
jgi:hypothetical protein